jgi:cyclomaltodextrin glucanotransferase
LQRGLQHVLELEGDRAAFLRVYERGEEAETALVLLNKGDAPARFEVDRVASAGAWRDALGGSTIPAAGGKPLSLEVPAHGVRVLLLAGRVEDPALRARLEGAMEALGAGGND